MTKLFVFASALGSILLSSECRGQTPAAPVKPAFIHGRARSANGEGIQNAAVSLRRATDPYSFVTAKTGQDGNFTLPFSQPGRFELLIQSPGFISLRKSVDAVSGNDIDTGEVLLNVQGGDSVEVERISITGRAVDPTGAGIGGGSVRLKIGGYVEAPLSKTDKEGNFRFRVAAAKQYDLVIEVPGFQLFRKTIQGGDGRDIDVGIVRMDLGRQYPQILVNPGRVQNFPAANLLARFVIDELDVTSFPSSIGPRIIEGKTYFRDYGFIPTKYGENEAILEESDRSWTIHLTILKAFDEGISVCFEDRATYPASYHTQGVLWVVKQAGKNSLKGTWSDGVWGDCPKFTKLMGDN